MRDTLVLLNTSVNFFIMDYFFGCQTGAMACFCLLSVNLGEPRSAPDTSHVLPHLPAWKVSAGG